ncbi:MAG: putative transcriptional regulator [Flavobacteriales bacterium]|jgi:putative transcriptional regulator
MTIEAHLDRLLETKQVKSKYLAQHAGIAEPNMSLLKRGKVKEIRFNTLDEFSNT